MSDTSNIKLQVRSDRPTAIASKAHNTKIDVLAFNISFIAKHQPKLALELLKLYEKAHVIAEKDPEAPDEDYALFADEIIKITKKKKKN